MHIAIENRSFVSDYGQKVGLRMKHTGEVKYDQ